jgi:hypothetical protein
LVIAPLQPHKSWYGQFWYAEHSPLGALADRLLLFAIVALSLLAGGMSLVRHHHPPTGDVRGPTPPAKAGGSISFTDLFVTKSNIVRS